MGILIEDPQAFLDCIGQMNGVSRGFQPALGLQDSRNVFYVLQPGLALKVSYGMRSVRVKKNDWIVCAVCKQGFEVRVLSDKERRNQELFVVWYEALESHAYLFSCVSSYDEFRASQRQSKDREVSQ